MGDLSPGLQAWFVAIKLAGPAGGNNRNYSPHTTTMTGKTDTADNLPVLFM